MKLNTLGARIKHVRGALSQEAFAAKLDISKGALGGYERNANQPPSDVLQRICADDSISIDWLVTGHGPMKRGGAGQEAVPAGQAASTPWQTRRLPVLALAACGSTEWYNPGPLATTLPMPVEHPYSSEIFAVIAIGMSMQPDGIRPGYVLYCDPSRPPAAADAVFIERHDGKVSVKRFLGQDGQWLHLQGWLPPDEKGDQEPFAEDLLQKTIRRIACVVLVQRKP